MMALARDLDSCRILRRPRFQLGRPRGVNMRRVIQVLLVVGSLIAPEADRASAGDWPQWCGSHGKNMVSGERGLPESFVPGVKQSRERTIDLGTAKNVKWGVKVCDAFYSTPSVAGGRVFLGGLDSGNGVFACLDEATGKLLWKWEAPPRPAPKEIDGFSIGIGVIPQQIGVCSSAAVEGDRLYFVSNRFDVLCLDVRGQPPGPEAGKARVLWTYDAWKELGVFPCDAANGSPVIDGDLLYVPTSNGVDRNSFQDPHREINRKLPAPHAPNLIVLDKRNGRLVATDDTRIAQHLLHGQWSSPSLGKVGDRKLVFFGGGDGRCYAFEALPSVPDKPVRLKTVWSYDCIPPEYKSTGGSGLDHLLLPGRQAGPGHAEQARRGVCRRERDHRHAGLPRQPRLRGHRPRSGAWPRPRGPALHRPRRDRRHHEDRQDLDLPGAGPHAFDRLGRRRPALCLRRGRPAALPRCRDGQAATGFTTRTARSGARRWWPTGKSTCPPRRAFGCSPPARS